MTFNVNSYSVFVFANFLRFCLDLTILGM